MPGETEGLIEGSIDGGYTPAPYKDLTAQDRLELLAHRSSFTLDGKDVVCHCKKLVVGLLPGEDIKVGTQHQVFMRAGHVVGACLEAIDQGGGSV